jgi:hypothetical protein
LSFASLSSSAYAAEDDARVVELVDTQDLKSCGFTAVRVQVPSRVQKDAKVFSLRIFYAWSNIGQTNVLKITSSVTKLLERISFNGESLISVG